MMQQPLVDQCLLIIEASKSHSDAPYLVGLLWMTDQPDTQTSTWQHSRETDSHAPAEFKPMAKPWLADVKISESSYAHSIKKNDV